MELLGDGDVSSMEVAAEQSELSSPDAIAIASMGRLLGQRINAEVQEYTAVLGRLVLDMERGSGGGSGGDGDGDGDGGGSASDSRARGGPAGRQEPLQERCCAAKLLRMHVLMAAIGRALDGADQ